MNAIPVKPVSTRRSGAFVDGVDPKTGKRFGRFETVDFPVYPPSHDGRELRAERVRLGLSLRDGARLLGLGLVELSGLETGSHTFATAEEWAEARRRLLAGAWRTP